MPKVSQNSSHPPSGPLADGPHPLKRNQVRVIGTPTHSLLTRSPLCRRAISDATRPACATCIRSHAHAVAHASPGTRSQLPLAPECTFDEIADVPVVNEVPKSRYEKLEARIYELEALLREKEQAESSGPSPPTVNQLVDLFPGSGADILSTGYTQSPLDNFISSQTIDTSTAGSSPLSSLGLEMIWPHYPPGLPGPDLLKHLVEVFFTFHPHARRIIHWSSFMLSLALSPGHPKFPATPILHAIAAVGSLYTAAVTSPPLPNFKEVDPDEIFSQRHRIREDRPDSFAEQQAKFARDTADHLESLGDRLFEVLQARVILTWFYWSHSKQIFVSSSHSLRVAVPLGLNMCPPFHSITHSIRPGSIIAPAHTVVEDETRRNTFWLAYCAERLHGCSNGWATSLDDQDISQLLPVRGDHYEQGTLVTPPNRQWAHSRDLLLLHPDKQTDSFILYIKAAIMISEVKTFNSRFRAKHFFGDASVTSPHNEQINPLEPVDPRGSPAFIELDNITTSFRSSFPIRLRTPIVDNVVDQHFAIVLLHDPHANVRRSGCISALKILTAARSILDLAYNVCSTSFDVTLLDPFCSFCWFISGRVLVRFLQAAMDANTSEQIATLRAELEFIQSAIARIGQRIPLAFRYAKMLNDLIVNRCGESSAGESAQLTFPRPLEYDMQAIFQPNIDNSRGTSGSFLAVA
ncbi:hypothetical protein B0H10DRAFT_2166192 [Mycena sp. CBHHK59/15]|nr:hypothetical protein B0H10DRAFT_2166192 [Mycena sp. CBHHK59/15]